MANDLKYRMGIDHWHQLVRLRCIGEFNSDLSKDPDSCQVSIAQQEAWSWIMGGCGSTLGADATVIGKVRGGVFPFVNGDPVLLLRDASDEEYPLALDTFAGPPYTTAHGRIPVLAQLLAEQSRLTILNTLRIDYNLREATVAVPCNAPKELKGYLTCRATNSALLALRDGYRPKINITEDAAIGRFHGHGWTVVEELDDGKEISLEGAQILPQEGLLNITFPLEIRVQELEGHDFRLVDTGHDGDSSTKDFDLHAGDAEPMQRYVVRFHPDGRVSVDRGVYCKLIPGNPENYRCTFNDFAQMRVHKRDGCGAPFSFEDAVNGTVHYDNKAGKRQRAYTSVTTVRSLPLFECALNGGRFTGESDRITFDWSSGVCTTLEHALSSLVPAAEYMFQIRLAELGRLGRMSNK